MKPLMRKNKKNAFTLIELLVTTVMLSVVCLAIYSTFASGARIWQRINRLSLNEDLNMFFDRFTTDVKNSVVFTGQRFQGAVDRVELPTLVSSAALEARTVGRAVYSYSGQALARSQSDYSQLYQNVPVHPRHVLNNVRSCKFSFYQYDQDKKEYSWVEEWEKDELPLAVRMSLTVGTDTQAADFVKTVNVPLGGSRKKNE
jgi:prepilin-type N-terminal cleavage/methylation domain-containing protein